MATLKKLGICGIRSFGCEEDDKQLIKFQKPLTLILGENGCGKSTIIECLRYVAAQKEPSGTGTFVHDPRIANKPEVKAYIKLNIRDKKNDPVDLSRSIQATKTKKTLQTKSLDNTITRYDPKTGEAKSISSRCADFGAELSRAFGVSRAILEHVIFCTQEDSHWPLDTDKKLKEKFDEIFDSKKYNHCVNKVRDQKKKYSDDLRASDIEVKHLKEFKAEADSKKNKLQRTKEHIEECNNTLVQLKQKLTPLEDNLKAIMDKEMDISEVYTAKETKKTELKGVEEYVEELKKHVQNEFSGTDEELHEKIKNFHHLTTQHQLDKNKLEEKIEEFTKNENSILNRMQSEQVKYGQLQKDESLHKEKVTERNKCLNSLASRLGIQESSQMSQFTDDSVQVLLNQTTRRVNDRKEGVDNTRRKLELEEQELQNLIDKLREECINKQNDAKNKEKSVETNRNDMKKVKQQIDEVDQSATTLAKLEAQLSNVTRNLADVQNSMNVEQQKSEIEQLSKKIKQLEDEQSEVESDIERLQHFASTKAELDVHVEQKNSKESEMKRLQNKHSDSLKSLLGSLPSSGYKAALQGHVDVLTRQVRELTTQRNKKENERVTLETNRKHSREQLRQKQDLLRFNEEEIFDQCGTGDLSDIVKNLNSQIQELQDIKGTLSSSQFMYQRYIRSLQNTDPCCPLCHRNFEREAEALQLVEELSSKVREVPARLTDNKIELEEKQVRYDKLLTLTPTYDKISVLKNVEIPELKTQSDTIDSNLTKIRTELDDLANEILGPQTDEAICASIQGDMVLLDQLQAELRRKESEISKLQTMLPATAGNRSLQEALSHQGSLRTSLKTNRQKYEESRSKLITHNEQVQKLQANKTLLMENMSKAKGGIGQRKQYEDRYLELQKEESVLLEELESAREQLGPAQKNLDDHIAKRNRAKCDNKEQVARLDNEMRELQSKLEDIKKLQVEISLYEGKGIQRKLESVQTILKSLQVQKEEIKEKKQEIVEKINDIKKDLTMQQVREREYEDNRKLREKRNEREKLEKEIKQLEEKYGNLNYTSLQREKKKIKNEIDNIEREKASINGRIGELNNQVQTTEKELSSRNYKLADDNYKKEFVNNEVLKAITADLTKYAIAMEWAMMTYHREQMSKVNTFIREYWRKIYQGNDIDYIEIQTDDTMLSDKRRNYNYRVIQVKEEVELDMRNRCSAGQKMLASLIIRMALAETFSSNCGIITLDEPTTNLDRKNVRNLAKTLSEILNTKQKHSHNNFQLIVITHDEQFLKDLNEVDAVSDYVKVTRNRKGRTRVTIAKLDGTQQDNRRNNHDQDYLD